MIYVVATIVVCIWIYNFLGGPLVETILLTLKAVFEEIGKWMP